MKTSWVKQTGNRTEYVDVHFNSVVVGHNYGTGMSDIAGSCTHEEFLNGRFQGLVAERFGDEVLAEVILAVKSTGENPEHNKKRDEIRQLLDFLETIPEDPALRNLHRHQDTISGRDIYGNISGYKSMIESDTTVFIFEGTRGEIRHKREPGKIVFKLNFFCTCCVENHDVYYMTGSEHFHVVSPEGKILFTTQKEKLEDEKFGSYLRIGNVYKNGGIIFFSYRWFYGDRNPGLIRYEQRKGLAGRVEIDEE
ncbi:MAG: hypothetical protein JW969_00130 [Spirochaetales bacterium]|nr:hypothetical protein [Spirochaetales bacterium]